MRSRSSRCPPTTPRSDCRRCRSTQRSRRRPSKSGPAATPPRQTPTAYQQRSPVQQRLPELPVRQHLPELLGRLFFHDPLLTAPMHPLLVWRTQSFPRSGSPTLLSPRPPAHRQCDSQRVRRQPLRVFASAPRRPPYGATRLSAPPRVPEQDSRRGYQCLCPRRQHPPHRSGPHRPTPPPPQGRQHRPRARNRGQSDEPLPGPDPSGTRPRSAESPRSIALSLVLAGRCLIDPSVEPSWRPRLGIGRLLS